MGINLANHKWDEESLELLRATASDNEAKRLEVQQAFGQQMTRVLKKAVFDENTLEDIYERMQLAPGAEAKFPLDFVEPGTEDDYTAFRIPKQGRIPEKHIEGDELWVPTYEVGQSIDWRLNYAKDARWDVVSRAMEVFRAGYTKKLNDDGWHVILAAANAAGFMIRDTAATAGVFTPSLIYRMSTVQKRRVRNGRLTDVYVSLEALEDMRRWSENSIVTLGDGVKDRVFMAQDDPSLIRVAGVNVRALRELGAGTGGTAEEYQQYFTATLGGSLGAGGDLELVVGLDKSRQDSFIMPVREDLQMFPDPTLHRHQKAGYYGWARLGFACVDNRACILGSF